MLWKPFAVLSLLFCTSAIAQQAPRSPLEAATLAKDLAFPKEPSPLPDYAPRMGIHKPDGPGPFPALVLHHPCSGLAMNQTMLSWAKDAVSRAYVVLLIDSFVQRGVSTVCMGSKGGVNFARGVRDAMQAADHLRKLPFVDRKRIAHVGYSWGAMVGVLASSKAFSTAVGGSSGFAAFVSFYPGCFTIRPPQGAPFEIVRGDIHRPLLVLMGGKDNEAPPSDCVSRLSTAKSAGAPVQWHLYPEATHCWDCKHLEGQSKIDFRGTRVVYNYDKSITADSGRRLFEFLEKVWTGKR